MKIRFVLFSLLLALVLASPAAAHKLKVFAAVEGNQIAGYGFFIGGGRAQDTPWVAKTENGTVVGEGRTGPEGDFRFTVPEPLTSDITVSLNTEEGHIASKTIAAARFGTEADTAAGQAQVAVTTTGQNDPASAAAPPQVTEKQIAGLVETAVQRQVEPLLERIEQMDDRLRITDILSGIFLIIGLAGIGLWARGLKK